MISSYAAARSFSFVFILASIALLSSSSEIFAHGTLVDGRMYEVRVAGSAGGTPAPWNDTYYTYNQNSQNFPGYSGAGFSYAAVVPDGSIGNAGINDGVQSGLDFRGLNIPSAQWTATPAEAGETFGLHWIATAPHDPSYFEVWLTKPAFDPTTMTLGWSDLDYLGRWAESNVARPVTKGTGPSPIGGSMLSYDWSIPIPSTASGRELVVVIWQREDPAGEAFFATQDLMVNPIPEPSVATLLCGGLLIGGRRCRGLRLLRAS